MLKANVDLTHKFSNSNPPPWAAANNGCTGSTFHDSAEQRLKVNTSWILNVAQE